MVRPWRRVRCPSPPPRVRPPTPVVEMIPLGTASPYGWAAWSTSPQRQPACTRTVPVFGSTRMPRMGERSTTRPSFTEPSPPALWPPPRMARGMPLFRAKARAVCTSVASTQRASAAGRLSIIPL